MEFLKIKIHHAQNVGKVPFGAISGNFFHRPGNAHTNSVFVAIFLGGPLAAIQPVWEMVAIFLLPSVCDKAGISVTHFLGSLSETISPAQVDSSKGPHRVNGAHWPTKENRPNLIFFF